MVGERALRIGAMGLLVSWAGAVLSGLFIAGSGGLLAWAAIDGGETAWVLVWGLVCAFGVWVLVHALRVPPASESIPRLSRRVVLGPFGAGLGSLVLLFAYTAVNLGYGHTKEAAVTANAASGVLGAAWRPRRP